MVDVVRRVNPRMSEDEYMRKMVERRLTGDSRQEIPDPTPMEPPVGYERRPSIFEQTREMVRREMALRMDLQRDGFEIDEDAEDFDEDDDFPRSHREYTEKDEADIRGLVETENRRREEAAKAAAAKPPMDGPAPGAKAARQGAAKPPREALDEPAEPGE